jgi:hypothetical protein
MRPFFGASLLLLALAAPAVAGTLTYNVQGPVVNRQTNAKQDDKIARLRDRNNTNTGQQQTSNEWLKDMVDACLQSQAQTLSKEETLDYCTWWHTDATQAYKDSVIAGAPNGVAPCLE